MTWSLLDTDIFYWNKLWLTLLPRSQQELAWKDVWIDCCLHFLLLFPFFSAVCTPCSNFVFRLLARQQTKKPFFIIDFGLFSSWCICISFLTCDNVHCNDAKFHWKYTSTCTCICTVKVSIKLRLMCNFSTFWCGFYSNAASQVIRGRLYAMIWVYKTCGSSLALCDMYSENETSLCECHKIVSKCKQTFWHAKGGRIYSSMDGIWPPFSSCGLCATWVWRTCGFYLNAAFNQVWLFYTSLHPVLQSVACF